jgi:hypothetical protein
MQPFKYPQHYNCRCILAPKGTTRIDIVYQFSNGVFCIHRYRYAVKALQKVAQLLTRRADRMQAVITEMKDDPRLREFIQQDEDSAQSLIQIANDWIVYVETIAYTAAHLLGALRKAYEAERERK